MHVTALNLERGWRGGEHQVFLLTRELMRRGVRQTVIARRGEPLAERLRSLVFEAGDEPARIVKPEVVEVAHSYEAFRRLPRQAASGSPLIYHAHTGNTVPVAVLGAGWRHRSVVTRHLDRPVTPWLYARADRVVAVSEGVRRVLGEAGISHERLRLIPTAIDQTRTFDPSVAPALRDEYGIAEGATVGLTIAAMTDEKDPLTPVRALPLLPDDYVHVLVGDGPLQADVRRIAAELGVADRLVLPGFDPHPDRWFSIADVFIFPSRWEALGMVALDAFFFGVPVVASDIEGTRGLLDDEVSCVRFSPGDAAGLAAAVHRVNVEKELAAGLVAEGKGRLRDYDVRRTAESYLELYQELVGAP